MRMPFFVIPILARKIIVCTNILDCPKYHYCVKTPLIGFCKKATPVYRPAPVLNL
jgi:hypothetical protein